MLDSQQKKGERYKENEKKEREKRANYRGKQDKLRKSVQKANKTESKKDITKE